MRTHKDIDWKEVKYTIRCDWKEYLRLGTIPIGFVLLFGITFLLGVTFFNEVDDPTPQDVAHWIADLIGGDR